MFTGEFDKIINFGVSEIDRLSYVVNQIDNDCHIVPIGSIKKIPLSEVRRNEGFRGLKNNQLFDLKNYVHFRAPQNKDKLELNSRNQGIYNDEFLDGADSDLPAGTWSMIHDTSDQTSLLRSKLWPGFYMFARQNTDIFGNFYIGNGCKSLDMTFQF